MSWETCKDCWYFDGICQAGVRDDDYDPDVDEECIEKRSDHLQDLAEEAEEYALWLADCEKYADAAL